MDLNWNDLKYFLAVCRKKTLVAAATELKVTHSTVARRISALEETLRTRLFHRTEKGCVPTPAAEKLTAYAEQMENTAAVLEETVSGFNEQISGAIRIGAPDGIGHSFLSKCLGKLQADHPGLNIELIAVPTYYSLSKREIDILITVQKPVAGRQVVRRLTRYRLGLFAAPSYLNDAPEINRAKDLKRHSFVGYIDDLLFDRDLDFMDEILPGLTVKFKSSTVVAQMNAVQSGAGIGVIPYFMAHGQAGLVPVLPEKSIERGYWLQVNPESRQLARVRVTIDFLVARAGRYKNRFLTLPGR